MSYGSGVHHEGHEGHEGHEEHEEFGGESRRGTFDLPDVEATSAHNLWGKVPGALNPVVPFMSFMLFMVQLAALSGTGVHHEGHEEHEQFGAESRRRSFDLPDIEATSAHNLWGKVPGALNPVVPFMSFMLFMVQLAALSGTGVHHEGHEEHEEFGGESRRGSFDFPVNAAF